jgi:hypothetical protein
MKSTAMATPATVSGESPSIVDVILEFDYTHRFGQWLIAKQETER